MLKKYRLLILLCLLILIPISLLFCLSIQYQDNEELRLNHQYQSLINKQLKSVDELIKRYFFDRQTTIFQDIETLKSKSANIDSTISYETDFIRNYLNHTTYISHLYIETQAQQRLFPPFNSQSVQEQQFLLQLSDILMDRSQFTLTPSDKNTLNTDQLASKDPSAKQSYEAVQAVMIPQKVASSNLNKQYVANGWLLWYSHSNQQLFFWLRDFSENLLIFQLNRVRMLSDLITLLPDGDDTSQGLNQAAIRLVNERSQNLYLWGKHAISDNEMPVQQLYLSSPLSSWKLEYYSAEDKLDGSQRLNLLLGLISLSIVLISLGVYFYRERSREQREASQRVNFVNQVSHELKTPLTNIRMYSELSQEFKDDEEKTAKYINVIVSESLRLSRLIENVLNFSRSQQSKLNINKTSGLIGECIKKTIKAHEAAWNKQEIAVEFEDNCPEEIYFDNMALEQILNNLFSNTEKYAASGKKIIISTACQQAICTLRVRDFGAGIADELKECIFEPFYRISSQLTDGVSGTGIGLSISRQLARLHGGDLQLESCSDGACFVITLNIEEPL